MNSKKFSEALNEINNKYINEAIYYKKNITPKFLWIRWAAVTACLLFAAVGVVILYKTDDFSAPNPKIIQIASPVITVESTEEMEEYLDFYIPVLDKEVLTYSVLVLDNYPTIGQIDYADGTVFRIKYGSGDISGVYGSLLEEIKEINGVKIKCYKNTQTTYAVWEQNGFAFSYIYDCKDLKEVEVLIERFK